MNRITFLLLAFTTGMSAGARAIDPDDLNHITFHNDTGYDIKYLFLSPGDSGHWGTDILNAERWLYDGDSLAFFIYYPDECNTFDIKAIDEDNDSYIIWDYEICDSESAEIYLTLDQLSDSSDDLDLVTVNLSNDTDYDIWYLFFSPDDSKMWGVDQLDEQTILQPGETLSLLLPVTDQLVGYDVHAVDEDEDTYTFSVEVDDSTGEYYFSITYADLDL